MKFGDTLYQRSVPKWAAYNVNYNEIKRMIKVQTTDGIATPISIPGQGTNRWTDLENELFQVLKQQYENVGLFMRSKSGEVDRRLAHLEKQLKAAQRGLQQTVARPILQGRRYHKLLQEADSIGEDIQALSRFASVQKTAFRKILKKYRKWTNSTSLQIRLEDEVFSTKLLDLAYAIQLDRLSTQTKLITEELQGPMVRGERLVSPTAEASTSSRLATTSTSTVDDINGALDQGPLHLDAALATIPFGQSSGLATYWIHPDNLDEACVLIMRHVQELGGRLSRQNSVDSNDSQSTSGSLSSSYSKTGSTHTVYFDNIQRFLQDKRTTRPTRTALSARWCHNDKAIVALSNLAPIGSDVDVVTLKKKDLKDALAATNSSPQVTGTSAASRTRQIRDYLMEHRDVKPMAEVCSTRSRYKSMTSSSKVGLWATLDTDVLFTTFDANNLGNKRADVESAETFPHAVFEVRWEFGHIPQLVRALDSSHLAERIKDFSLESAALHATHKDLEQPSWMASLSKDIRKLPIAASRRTGASMMRTPMAGTASGTSSTDDPSSSVFSSNLQQSSATSEASLATSPTEVPAPGTQSKPETVGPPRKKKKARIAAVSPVRQPQRYWNEFDDGDSDTNPDGAYTIYVDPDEKFSGVETVSKAFGALYRSCSDAKARVSSWLPLGIQKPKRKRRNERTPLLGDPDLDADSSDSDTTPTASVPGTPSKWGRRRVSNAPSMVRTVSNQYRPHQPLTRRQRALERTYFRSYVGLLLLGYVFLFMSTILLATGRKKVRAEVDVGVVTGIVAAEVCGVVSMLLIWMRRMPLGGLHWSAVSVAATGILIAGIALGLSTAGFYG